MPEEMEVVEMLKKRAKRKILQKNYPEALQDISEIITYFRKLGMEKEADEMELVVNQFVFDEGGYFLE